MLLILHVGKAVLHHLRYSISLKIMKHFASIACISVVLCSWPPWSFHSRNPNEHWSISLECCHGHGTTLWTIGDGGNVLHSAWTNLLATKYAYLAFWWTIWACSLAKVNGTNGSCICWNEWPPWINENSFNRFWLVYKFLFSIARLNYSRDYGLF